MAESSNASAANALADEVYKSLTLDKEQGKFMHRMDMERIVDSGPWNFMQNLIILAKVPLGTNPKQVPLIKATYWVQLHDYPIGSRSERAFQEMGNYIEEEIHNDGRQVDKANQHWDTQEPGIQPCTETIEDLKNSRVVQAQTIDKGKTVVANDATPHHRVIEEEDMIGLVVDDHKHRRTDMMVPQTSAEDNSHAPQIGFESSKNLSKMMITNVEGWI
ncbi:hypothetical protein K2173_006688 [Erythroxylum novogranatense]|uniref:DUF4283 domain-containing protein n=1 Tax=Erythroxylum novogranatense TaxID=1862640 RepID=A0AAV8SYV2_9ROSI|nr:hypothetical protein K2173_006688 [Erythroxylum novogranatense]